jgi:hypothetical protein
MTVSPAQYFALALQSSFHGVRDRSAANIESVSILIDVAIWMSETELPVRLIAIPEGTLQGFADEVFDMNPCVTKGALSSRTIFAGATRADSGTACELA